MNEFKKKLDEKIKQYSNEEYLRGYFRTEFLTDDKDADIYLNIDDISELFDSRTIGRQIDLLPEIYEYIESKTSMLDSDVQIDLHIFGIELSQEDQNRVRHLIKEHYAIELYKVQKEYLRIKSKIFKLIGIGVVSFLLYLWIILLKDFEFGVEITGFLFTFALWEGFDSMLYDFRDAKEQREDIAQNLLINVEFNDTKNLIE